MKQTYRFSSLLYLFMLVALAACQAPVQSLPTNTPVPPQTLLSAATSTPANTAVPTQTPDPFPNPVLKIAGEEEIVFDWDKDRCENLDIPDLPARAFRDDEGNVQLIASHYVNYRFIGPDLNSIKRDCQPVMRSASVEDPSKFSYYQWIASPYTEDGKTIYALVHDEYYGSNAYIPCVGKFVGDPSCLYNAITLAVSSDGGKSYQAAAEPPANLIAAAPYPFEAGAGPYGFFNPSNIIMGMDGYYYVYMREHFYQKGGNVAAICVLRTDNLADATSWRAWDGRDFTVSFVNPYLQPDQAKSAPECKSIPAEPGLGVMNESITFNTYLERYVMVGVTAMNTNGREIWGVLYSFSHDLVHWEPRKLLYEVELPWTYQPGDPDYYLYPSLLDPDSPSRNFDTTGQHVYLYLTRNNKNSSSNPLNRDLIRIPVEILPFPERSSGYTWEFESDGNTEEWTALNQLTELQVSAGHLMTVSTGVDPYMLSGTISVDAKTSPIVRIKMKTTSGEWAQLFFVTEIDGAYNEAKSLRFAVQGDGKFHEYVLDMSNVEGWQSAITQIRLDPTEVPADIAIDFVRMGTQ